MDITFCGTNGWYDTETGNTPCILIQTDSVAIVCDAGNGLHRLDKFLCGNKPVYLFLSHFHLDHVAGLHILNHCAFGQGLHIYGQPGTGAILDTLLRAPFTVPLARLPYPTEVHEIDEGTHDITVPGPNPTTFRLSCRYLRHSAPCLGFRFELAGRAVAYCTDTGVCDNVEVLGHDADLLIVECSFKPGQVDARWPHLNPESAIEMAQRASARRLALTHFDASIYRTQDDRRAVQEAFAGAFPGLIVAQDGMTVSL